MFYSPDICLNVEINDVARGSYRNARIVKHHGHSEWTRQGEELHRHWEFKLIYPCSIILSTDKHCDIPLASYYKLTNFAISL